MRKPAKPLKFNSSLDQERLRIFNEELERAFYHAGKRIFMLELDAREGREAHQAVRACERRDPGILDQLCQLISESVTTLAQYYSPVERFHVSPLARNAITILEDYIFNEAGPEGLSLAEAAALLHRATGHFANPTVMQAMLQRTAASHRLTIRHCRVTRSGGLLIELLERRFREQQQQDTQRVIERITERRAG